MQIVEPDDDRGRATRQEQIASMTRPLKQFALALQIPIIVLCQLNREVERHEDKGPQLADLRDSGTIEQDADVVLLLHRAAFHDPAAPPGEAELIIARNRGGAVGRSVRLAFDGPTTRSSDYHPMPQEYF